ncbi:unnamed protein product [Bursaphelenchus xylophilus]|uniref:(pine wood nematode) hypothetical protein n=1 Tax=Bursaphelenchus xylophilus TaxID=6326 RepID=A0A7I8X2Z1_BURXY|nr:unnamed protein product [Bursaphelenchus xylophilus]CAG9131284.1 unnamed protein product [Bursaphelenchus xylophilus]
MCIKKKVQQPAEQTAPPPVEPPVEPSVATALPQSPEKKKSVDLADRSTYTAKSDLFPEEKTLKDKKHKTIPKVKKRNTDGKTIEEDAANVTGALKGLGHNASQKQWEMLLKSAREEPRPFGEIRNLDTVFTPKKPTGKSPGKKTREEDTLHPKLAKEKTAEGDVVEEGDGCETPGPNEEFVEDEEKSVDDENWMYLDKEINFVLTELLRSADPTAIIEGGNEEEKKKYKTMKDKVSKIKWNPFRPLEEMEGEVEKYVFSYPTLRRNTFVSHAVTMPRGNKPVITHRNTRTVTILRPFLKLSEFPTPTEEIPEATIKDVVEDAPTNRSHKREKTMRSQKSRKEERKKSTRTH